ncbi:VOC family protein [Nocardioides nitrophenolicus]|uniref:VOC family protein n=1 Tax=Nocardioides nitrophenolicus TaxID=60489 RepID=UPI00195E31A8|nr:VOC family protein [Nocardioides nitrophenolicus]MBM7517157.1 catechol 2,3-dioxygenase-like lactoylglutathione lyase family enzyme [Nocardioides nitrophenolicus]
MTSIHHVGITVSDLARSLAFYEDLLGGERLGPYERSGPRIDAVTGYPGVVVRQAFVRAQEGGTVVELLQYDGGSDVVLDPDNGNVGAAHVAITVTDLDGTLDRLRERGVTALSEPIVASEPMAGHRVVYVLDPDRVRVELVEPPAR